MMSVKSVVFHSADNIGRKGLVKAAHGLLSVMLHGKRKGDSIRIVMDDGSTEDHIITGSNETHDGLQVDLAPGVVP
jgi:hypothetical protein